jgi:capsular exopolysaccharide synthesis family protein
MADLIPFRGDGTAPAPPNGAVPRHPADYEQDRESIDLREVLGTLRRNVGLVAFFVLATMGVTAFTVLRQEPQYRARATVRLLDERKALTGDLAAGAMEGMMGRMADPLLSQMQVLRSRTVGGAVVDRLGLRLHSPTRGFSLGVLRDVHVSPDVVGDTLELRFDADGYVVQSGGSSPLRVSYGAPARLGGIEFTLDARPTVDEAVLVLLNRDAAINRLVGGLHAATRDRTDVVDVEYVSGTPALSQRVVNAVVEEYRALNTRTAQDQSRRRRAFVEEQLEQTELELAEAQLALTRFREQERVYSSPQRLATQQTGLMGLEVRREEMDADRRMYRTLLSGLDQPTGGGRDNLRTLVSAPGIAANPVVAQLFEQLVHYEIAVDTLTTGAWSRAQSNPDVHRAQTLLASTRERLTEAVRSHLSVLDARITALDELKARSATELASLPSTEAEEMRLATRVETIRKVADRLREEQQKARIAEAVEVGQVEVVDLASVPTEPVGSGRSLKLGLGLMLGLMMGGGAAFVREHLNTAIRQREDLERVLHVPGLAVIPRLGEDAGRSRRKLPSLPRFGQAQSNGVQRGTTLVTAIDTQSGGSEAFRALRTSLLFSQSASTMRRLVITSSTPSEGKTTTSANLAITFAQQGMKVLLVDCDLRRPQIHATFGIGKDPGLTELLLGYATSEKAIRPTQVENLSVLTTGTLPPNPAELLGGPRMQELLDQLAEEFDLVLLDTPPLGAASDAAVLAAKADGALLVVRAGKTDRATAAHAMQQLRSVGARVLGAVLNDPDATVGKYGGYYYYYSYYGEKA